MGCNFLHSGRGFRRIVGVVLITIATGAVSRTTEAQLAPDATTSEVAAAVAMSAPIPANATYQPDWNSLAQNTVPTWLSDAKFGIMMHWGLYSSTATHNEWDEKYINGANSGIRDQFTTNFGPRNTFGYLDVLDPTKGPNATGAAAYIAAGSAYEPFTASNFNPTQWANLFAASGAKYVTISAEHHDGFALWNSQVTPFNTVNFGPHQDLVGELSTAVKTAGLKFGIQNHEIENYSFMAQVASSGPVGPGITHTGGGIVTPNDFNQTMTYVDKNGITQTVNRSDFYRPDLKTFTDGNDAMTHFLDDWYERNVELINNYHPDMIWFDNGINPRVLDPLKQKLAAFYYNQAKTWAGSPQVTVTGKQDSYLAGSAEDYEKTIPTSIQALPFQVEETVTNGSAWGYVELGGSNTGFNTSVSTYVHDIAHIASLNGSLLLNIAPKADGTIPQQEQDVLTGIGSWLAVDGDAIYGTHPWTKFSEGSTSSAAHTSADFRFTTKDGFLYAIMMGWPTSGNLAKILSLGTSDFSGATTITSVQLLGNPGNLAFTRTGTELDITLPSQQPAGTYAFAFKISGTGIAVPEPVSVGVLGAGVTVLLIRRRRGA